jgi:hypothetical protein
VPFLVQLVDDATADVASRSGDEVHG